MNMLHVLKTWQPLSLQSRGTKVRATGSDGVRTENGQIRPKTKYRELYACFNV